MARKARSGSNGWVASKELGLKDPERRTITCADYANAGDLCPDGELERLAGALWLEWKGVSDESLAPVTLILDFTGVRILRHGTVNDALVYAYAASVALPRLRPCYMVFDNLSDEVSMVLGTAFLAAEVVAVGREAPGHDYKLIGHHDKVVKFQLGWPQLKNDGRWVNGRAFEAAKRLPKNTLEEMHISGVAVKDVDDRPYYRSIV